ncbi:MAG: toxin-antitoxin system HicB family antitoxin [Deltaproteobacteria bacterium]|nr:toxin-antitoxin system HicB family antitoxin [Deltaproteobacteria bacterium]RLB30826.1 MAG: hypothetical protein DRH11_14230 [Deltaproteobacteria bacterium]
MKKNIDYYMRLPYTIEVVPIPDSEGGGFTARLPEVGRFAITGDGETPEEAIRSLRKAQKERFKEYLKKGLALPEPVGEREEYSGRFLVRLPKILHGQLALEARENGISLNQYVVYLLSSNFQLDRQRKQFNRLVSEIGSISTLLWDIRPSRRLYDMRGLRHGSRVKARKAEVIELPDYEDRNAA